MNGAFPPTQNPQECVCVISLDIFSNPLSFELAEQSTPSGTGKHAARSSGLMGDSLAGQEELFYELIHSPV